MQYPESNRGWSVRLGFLSTSGWFLPEAVRDSLMLFLGAIGVVLLIACANVASLLFARAAARQKGDRHPCRARRRHASGLFKQLLTESLLLSIAAGGIGLALGAAATRLLVASGPASVPRLDKTSLISACSHSASPLSATDSGDLRPGARTAALEGGARGRAAGCGRAARVAHEGPQRARSILTVRGDRALSDSLDRRGPAAAQRLGVFSRSTRASSPRRL